MSYRPQNTTTTDYAQYQTCCTCEKLMHWLLSSTLSPNDSCTIKKCHWSSEESLRSTSEHGISRTTHHDLITRRTQNNTGTWRTYTLYKRWGFVSFPISWSKGINVSMCLHHQLQTLHQRPRLHDNVIEENTRTVSMWTEIDLALFTLKRARRQKTYQNSGQKR